MASPRTQFYHPAAAIDAALQGIERAVRRAEGIALVVGQPGTGKSLLLGMIAEHVREDFDVALLCGARICTRRALWQSILAEIGEPYRGIDEVELRIALVERIRGLAATGSGLVILVDEAHTLPTRLIEELRLLTNVPTPLPAVHIVLAGSTKLEELLALPRMESLAQRIAVRGYLEPLDHAETLAYLRTQTKAAALDWERLFEPGCDAAVFTATDGVPRLINQLCDHALVRAGESGRRVTPGDIAAAWREIQRLPTPPGLAPADDRFGDAAAGAAFTGADVGELDDLAGDGLGVIEFGSFDGDSFAEHAAADDGDRSDGAGGTGARERSPADPWSGPEVELVFDASTDPFEEFFEQEERIVERYLMEGPDDFRARRHVKSREGELMGRQLESCERIAVPVVAATPPVVTEPAPVADAPAGEIDDTDMVVIEEDLHELPTAETAAVFTVRPGDYRSLFARLRRGDRGPSTAR
jgi:general secretion pathway protein A